MLLSKVVARSGIQLSEAIDADLDTLLSAAKQLGIEGVVAKRRDSKYQPGVRGNTWFKRRLGVGQEFVIGGFTHQPMDSLLVGYYERRKLLFAGKIKAGFVRTTKRAVFEKLKPLVIDKCPFKNLPDAKTDRWGAGITKDKMNECIWVQPRVVVHVEFVEWTNRGRLRHPKYVSLRDDKWVNDVVREG